MDRSIRTGVLGLGVGVLLGFPIHFVVDAQQPQQGRGRGMAFTEPSPIDFNDHEGYVSLFDGVSL